MFAFQKLEYISSENLVETQNVDNMEMIITQHFTHLHGVLQNTEKKIIDSLREHQNARGRNIKEILTQLDEHEERLQSALVVRITKFLSFLSFIEKREKYVQKVNFLECYKFFIRINK